MLRVLPFLLKPLNNFELLLAVLIELLDAFQVLSGLYFQVQTHQIVILLGRCLPFGCRLDFRNLGQFLPLLGLILIVEVGLGLGYILPEIFNVGLLLILLPLVEHLLLDFPLPFVLLPELLLSLLSPALVFHG